MGDRGSKKAYTGPRTGIYLPTKFGCDLSIVVGCRSWNDRQTSRQTSRNNNKAHSLHCERDAILTHIKQYINIPIRKSQTYYERMALYQLYVISTLVQIWAESMLLGGYNVFTAINLLYWQHVAEPLDSGWKITMIMTRHGTLVKLCNFCDPALHPSRLAKLSTSFGRGRGGNVTLPGGR